MSDNWEYLGLRSKRGKESLVAEEMITLPVCHGGPLDGVALNVPLHLHFETGFVVEDSYNSPAELGIAMRELDWLKPTDLGLYINYTLLCSSSLNVDGVVPPANPCMEWEPSVPFWEGPPPQARQRLLAAERERLRRRQGQVGAALRDANARNLAAEKRARG